MQNNPSATTRALQLQDLAILASILIGVIVIAGLYLARFRFELAETFVSSRRRRSGCGPGTLEVVVQHAKATVNS